MCYVAWTETLITPEYDWHSTYYCQMARSLKVVAKVVVKRSSKVRYGSKNNSMD